MAMNWLQFAEKLAESARKRLAADRKRLQEILAERQRKQVSEQSTSRSQ
jgi:exonuclease VII small subunit